MNAFALTFDVQADGLAIDASNNIWIATSGSSIIRRFNTTTNTVDQAIDLAKDGVSSELTGLANEAPGFVVGSSNRGVVYFQLDPPVGDSAATQTQASPASAATVAVAIGDAPPPDGLELAYVQRSWVSDFVARPLDDMADDEEDELLIALPTGK